MSYYIFRNFTVEFLFKGIDAIFSGYEDISCIDEKAKCYVWFYTPPYKWEEEKVVTEIENYEKMLEWVVSRTDKMILAFTMQRVFCVDFQVENRRVEQAIKNYNEKLWELSAMYSHLRIIDISDFYTGYSVRDLIDWKYYFISQMPLKPQIAKDFVCWFRRQVEIVELKRKKCIILDLDNTLWGGILGEDGADNIKIGEDYPGNAYRFFQQYLLELSRFGILLTVCSKNNEADVLEVWEKHPEMILRKEHFVAWQINWNNKADNIRELARVLNIGLDSMVFIDDNPTERELVKQVLPMVQVPDFPEQPYLYPRFARQLTNDYFKIYRLTVEDLSKTQQYKENSERNRFQNQFSDMESYLRSLELELTVESIDDYNITRMAQMTQKTNQFNLTTRRYTEMDLRNFESAGGKIWGLRVKDRFGDNGLTGLIMVAMKEDKMVVIDSFLLSCRVLGKNIEDVFIRYVLNKLKEAGIKKVQALFLKTIKNIQVQEFYDQVGFQLGQTSDERKEYIADLDKLDLKISDIYKIVEK